MALRQHGNNTYVGLLSDLPISGFSGSLFMSENTNNLYCYFSSTTPTQITFFASGSGGTESIRAKNSTTTNATANYAFAIGDTTLAKGVSSLSSGKSSIANGIYSFVHGLNSVASGDTTIVLGSNITGLTQHTTYVEDLNIKKFSAVPTSSTDTIGTVGSVTWDNNYFYWKTSTKWLRVSGLIF